jgi:hypothetical protein
MHSLKVNVEQFEALQKDANQSRESFVDSLPEEQQKKFRAIEQAVKILVDNKVLFYLFPYLQHPKAKAGVMTSWQWHSIMELVELDKDDKITAEFNDKANDFISSALSSIYQTYTQGIKTPEEKWNHFYEQLKAALQKEFIKNE